MSAPKQLVRSLLLGMVFGSSEWLGRGPAETQRALEALGEPDAGQRLFDRLITMRLPHSMGPGLRRTLDEVSYEYEGDALALIRDTIESPLSWMFTGPPVFPAFVFSDAGSTSSDTDTDRDVVLVDSHLHSGASVSVKDLLRLLTRSELAFVLPEDENDPRTNRDRLLGLWGTDAWGVSFSLPVVAGALRCYLARLSAPKEWLEGKNVCAQRWHERTFWSTVGVAARTHAGHDEFLDELFSGFSTGRGDFDPYVELRQAVLDAIVLPTHERLTSVYGALSCLALLHCSLSSRSGEGLGRFVARFDRMGMFRDLAVADEKHALVSASCDSIFSDSRVVGAEFRKTTASYGKTVEQCSRKLRTGLEDHLLGFLDYFLGCSREALLAVPVGFLRERRVPLLDSSRWTARTSLTSVSHLAQALVGLGEDPSATKFISGVDTAGDEGAMPNWPFLAAYSYIAESWPSPLSFSMHAGESFGHGLQGLRHISECLSSPQVSAIGHALALDQQASQLVVGDVWVDPTVECAVLDLAWCHSIGLEPQRASALLSEIVLAGGLHVYGVNAASLIEARMLLHSREGLTTMGMLDSESFWMPDYLDRIDIGEVDPVVMSGVLFGYRAPGKDRDLLDRSLRGSVAERFRCFAEDVEESARDYLTREVVGRNVVIEACPTSNVRLAGMPSIRSSHVGRLIALGIRTSMSSDDPVVFGTSVGREFELVRDYMGRDVARSAAATGVESFSGSREPFSALKLRELCQVVRQSDADNHLL